MHLSPIIYIALTFIGLIAFNKFVIPLLVKSKTFPIKESIRRNGLIENQYSHQIRYVAFFGAMNSPEEIREWIKKDIPCYFGEWPRDSAGFSRMVSGLASCKYAKSLEDDVLALEWLWENANKTSITIRNYNAVALTPPNKSSQPTR